MPPFGSAVRSLSSLPGPKLSVHQCLQLHKIKQFTSFKDEVISDTVKRVILFSWTSFLNTILFGWYERCDNVKSVIMVLLYSNHIIHLKRK